jgi:hypothetical protein
LAHYRAQKASGFRLRQTQCAKPQRGKHTAKPLLEAY